MNICLYLNLIRTSFEFSVVSVSLVSDHTKLISFHFNMNHVCFLAISLAIMVTNALPLLVEFMCHEMLCSMKQPFLFLIVLVLSLARHYLKPIPFLNHSSSLVTPSFNILLLYQSVLILMFLQIFIIPGQLFLCRLLEFP